MSVPRPPHEPGRAPEEDDPMPLDPISVVTLTRRRPEMLRRAMDSVRAQDYEGEIEHVIVIDDDADSVPTAEQAPSRPGLRVVPHLVRRPAEEVGLPHERRYTYPRQARLFNEGARRASTPWVAYLDDDNEYEPDHLRTLMRTARASGARAVHSGRKMLFPDGSPYLDELWHTARHRDLDEAARIYNMMCDRGVWIRGTNHLMDRADPVRRETWRPSTVIEPGDPVYLVDQSSWLIRRDVLMDHPIPETYSEEDHANNMAPDDKLLQVLLNNEVGIVPTGLPTVRYYLGGVSNLIETPAAPAAAG
ncbi:glycosyltransferase [Actinomadura sp. NEAU-AAG5]|uniref:Glycosyltransferase n=2 Tax=Actinomadura litoris TaxID=2678616 RepID=A0A7K1KXM8_9ACTN|nr:glycosyltransferase [Actinomadura litoris]